MRLFEFEPLLVEGVESFRYLAVSQVVRSSHKIGHAAPSFFLEDDVSSIRSSSFQASKSASNVCSGLDPLGDNRRFLYRSGAGLSNDRGCHLLRSDHLGLENGMRRLRASPAYLFLSSCSRSFQYILDSLDLFYFAYELGLLLVSLGSLSGRERLGQVLNDLSVIAFIIVVVV